MEQTRQFLDVCLAPYVPVETYAKLLDERSVSGEAEDYSLIRLCQTKTAFTDKGLATAEYLITVKKVDVNLKGPDGRTAFQCILDNDTNPLDARMAVLLAKHGAQFKKASWEQY